MAVAETIAQIFPPKSRKASATISSIVPTQVIDRLGEKLGKETADDMRKKLNYMNKNGMDLIQTKLEDGSRVRLSIRV